jgi:hypothetical protein
MASFLVLVAASMGGQLDSAARVPPCWPDGCSLWPSRCLLQGQAPRSMCMLFMWAHVFRCGACGEPAFLLGSCHIGRLLLDSGVCRAPRTGLGGGWEPLASSAPLLSGATLLELPQASV